MEATACPSCARDEARQQRCGTEQLSFPVGVKVPCKHRPVIHGPSKRYDAWVCSLYLHPNVLLQL